MTTTRHCYTIHWQKKVLAIDILRMEVGFWPADAPGVAIVIFTNEADAIHQVSVQQSWRAGKVYMRPRRAIA